MHARLRDDGLATPLGFRIVAVELELKPKSSPVSFPGCLELDIQYPVQNMHAFCGDGRGVPQYRVEAPRKLLTDGYHAARAEGGQVWETMRALLEQELSCLLVGEVFRSGSDQEMLAAAALAHRVPDFNELANRFRQASMAWDVSKGEVQRTVVQIVQADPHLQETLRV